MISHELTLGAQDAEDLKVISARLQDAVALVKDLVYLPKSRRFAALFNRFVWEKVGAMPGANTRVRAGLHFEGVVSCRAHNLRRDKPEAVVSLLAIRFAPRGADDPGGTVELVFSGGGTMKLEVECIEAGLSDISGEWAARGRPVHGA